MAGDWIKMSCDLHEKPEVLAVAAMTGLDVNAVVGRLHRLWSWFNQHTTNGNAASVTQSWVDVTLACEHFSNALQKVGWLECKEDGIRMVNFDYHNSNSAKQRALTNERVKRKRNAASVTKPLPEKRREEKSTDTKVSVGATNKRAVKPSEAEAELYASKLGLPQSEAVKFMDHYEANGWKVGRNPMKSWQAAMRNWKVNWEQWRKSDRSSKGDGIDDFENSIAAKEIRNA